MAKKTTFSMSISDYLTSEAKRLGAAGYSDWLSKSMTSAKSKYSDAVSGAATEYAMSLRDYNGSSGKLKNSGLNNSGYADYLNKTMKASYTGAIKEAKKQLYRDSAKSAIGYEGYINKLNEAKEKLIRTLTMLKI